MKTLNLEARKKLYGSETRENYEEKHKKSKTIFTF